MVPSFIMPNANGRRLLAKLPLWAAAAALVPLVSMRGDAQTAPPPTPPSQMASATVTRYCATCHSARVHTG